MGWHGCQLAPHLAYTSPCVKKYEVLWFIKNDIAVNVKQLTFIALIENILDDKIIMLLDDFHVITYNVAVITIDVAMMIPCYLRYFQWKQ